MLVVLSLALSACAGAAPGAGGGPIGFGAALCLTGIQAPLDEPALKGAQVAVDEINKTGGVLGKQARLINLDCKSDPVTTGNVAVKLDHQGAQAIIAPSDFDFGGPAEPRGPEGWPGGHLSGGILPVVWLGCPGR